MNGSQPSANTSAIPFRNFFRNGVLTTVFQVSNLPLLRLFSNIGKASWATAARWPLFALSSFRVALRPLRAAIGDRPAPRSCVLRDPMRSPPEGMGICDSRGC